MVSFFIAAWALQAKHAVIVLLCLFIFEFTFCCSNGTVFWLYIAEITVDRGLGLAVFVRMLTLFILTQTALPIFQSIGFDFFFIIFGLLQIPALLINHYFMKETNGLSTPAKKALYRPPEYQNEEEK